MFTIVQIINVDNDQLLTNSAQLSEQEVFENAQQLASEGYYADAIELFESIHEYNHSVDELSLLFSKYAGYYYDDFNGLSFHITKTGPEAADLDVLITEADRVIRISESFAFVATTNNVQYSASSNDSGTIVINLYNDSIVFTINSLEEVSYSNDYTFNLSDRMSTPRIESISTDTIMGWFNNDYALSDFINAGYSLSAAMYSEIDTSLLNEPGLSCYSLSDSDIRLIFLDYRFEYGNYIDRSENMLEDPVLVGVGVTERFFNGMDVDINNPFEIDGLFVLPHMDPDIFTTSYVPDDFFGTRLIPDRFLIVNASLVTDDFLYGIEYDNALNHMRELNLCDVVAEKYAIDYGEAPSYVCCAGVFGEDFNIYLFQAEDAVHAFYIITLPEDYLSETSDYQAIPYVELPVGYGFFDSHPDSLDHFPGFFSEEAMVAASNVNRTSMEQFEPWYGNYAVALNSISFIGDGILSEVDLSYNDGYSGAVIMIDNDGTPSFGMFTDAGMHIYIEIADETISCMIKYINSMYVLEVELGDSVETLYLSDSAYDANGNLITDGSNTTGALSQDQAHQAFANYYESIRYQYDGLEPTFTYDAADSDNYTCVYQFRYYFGASSYESVFYYMDLTTGTVRTQIYDEIPADSAAMPSDGAEEVMSGVWFVGAEYDVFNAWDYI